MKRMLFGLLAALGMMTVVAREARADFYTWYSGILSFEFQVTYLDPRNASVWVSRVVSIVPVSATHTRVTVVRTNGAYATIDLGGPTSTWFWSPAPISGDVASVMVSVLTAFQMSSTQATPLAFSGLWAGYSGSSYFTATASTRLVVTPATLTVPPGYPSSGLRGGTLVSLTIMDGTDVFGELLLREPNASRAEGYEQKLFHALRTDMYGRQLTTTEAGGLFAAVTTNRGVWMDSRWLPSENGRKLIVRGIRYFAFN